MVNKINISIIETTELNVHFVLERYTYSKSINSNRIVLMNRDV